MRPDETLRLTAVELSQVAGIGIASLERLVRLGLIEPEPAGDTFSAASAARLKRMLRIHDDLGVDLFGAVIIVDLLDRLERLDAELARLREHS